MVAMCSPSVLLESWAPGSSVSSILSNVGEGFRVVNEGMQQAVGEVCEGIKQKKKVLAATIFDMSIKMFLRSFVCCMCFSCFLFFVVVFRSPNK